MITLKAIEEEIEKLRDRKCDECELVPGSACCLLADTRGECNRIEVDDHEIAKVVYNKLKEGT